MSRKQENYDSETVNLRIFYIRLLSKLWTLFAAGIIGAVLFGGIYYLANTVYAPARQYVSEATLYIYFAYDENKGTEVDYYNAYTWNILIKSDEAIIGKVMENLESAGFPETVISRDEVVAAMSSDIPSDVRVMVFSVSHTNPEKCNAIAQAAVDALVSYGDSNSAFTQIKLLGRNDASPKIEPDRIKTAIVFGMLTGIVLMCLTLLILESMNDAIYIPEMAERRYRQPVLGILTKSGQEEPAFFRNELLEVTDSILKKTDRIAVLCVDDKTGKNIAEEGKKRLKEVLGSAFDEVCTEMLPLPLPGNDINTKAELKKVQGAIILMKAGKRNGAMTEHLLSHLKKLDCPVLGILLIEADKVFLERYLGL